MMKKLYKCLSVFLAWCMCLPVWGGSFTGAQMTNLNDDNYVRSHSSNIGSMTASGNQATVEAAGPTAWVRWRDFSIDSGKQLNSNISNGRMYFIVEDGSSQIDGTIVNSTSGTGFYLINPNGIGVGNAASFNANGGQIGLITGSLLGNFEDVFKSDGTIRDKSGSYVTGYPVVSTGNGGSIRLEGGGTSLGDLMLVSSRIEVGEKSTFQPGASVSFLAGDSVAVKNLDAKYLASSDLGTAGDLTVAFEGGTWPKSGSTAYNFIAAGSINLSAPSDSKDRMTLEAGSISIRAGSDVSMDGYLTLKAATGDTLSSRISVLAGDAGSISLGKGVELIGPQITGEQDGFVLLSAGKDILLQGASLGGSLTPSRAAELQAGGNITLDGISKTVDLNVQSFWAIAGGDILLKGTVNKQVQTASPAGGDNAFVLDAGGIIAQVKPGEGEDEYANALKFNKNGGSIGVDTVRLTAPGRDGVDAIALDGAGNSGLFSQKIVVTAGNVQSPGRNVALTSAEGLESGNLTGTLGGELSLKTTYGDISVKRANFERLGTLSATTASGNITVVDDSAGTAANALGIGRLVSESQGNVYVGGKYIHTAEGGEIRAAGGEVGLSATENLVIADGTQISGVNVTLGSDSATSSVKIGDGVTITAQAKSQQDGQVKISGGNIDIGTRGGATTTISAERTLGLFQYGETVAKDETQMGDHLYVEENVQMLSAGNKGVNVNYAGELWLFGQAMNQGPQPEKASVTPLSEKAKVKAMALDMAGNSLTLEDDGSLAGVHWIGYYNVGETATVKSDLTLTPTTGTGLPTDDRASYIRGAGDLTFSVADGKTLSAEGGFTLAANGDLKLAGNGSLDVRNAVLSLSGKNVSQTAGDTGILKAGTVNLLERTAVEGLNQKVTLDRLQADGLSGVGGTVKITADANANATDFTIAGDVTATRLDLDTRNRNVVSGTDAAAGRTAYTKVGALSIQAGSDRTVSLTTSGDFNFSAKDASGKEAVSLSAKSAELAVVNVDGNVAHDVKIGLGELSELTIDTTSPKEYVGESEVSVTVRNQSENLKVMNANNASGEYVDLKSLSVDQTGNLLFDQRIATSGNLSLKATGELGLATETTGGGTEAAANMVGGEVSLTSGNDLLFRNQGDLKVAAFTALSEGQAQSVTFKSDAGSIVVGASALNLNGSLNLDAAGDVTIDRQTAYNANTQRGWNGQLGDVTAVGAVRVETAGTLMLAGNLKVDGEGNVTLKASDEITQNAGKIVAGGLLTVFGGRNAYLLGDNDFSGLAGEVTEKLGVRVVKGLTVNAVTAAEIDVAADADLTVNGLLEAQTVRLTGNTVKFDVNADFDVADSTDIATAQDFTLKINDRSDRTDEYGTLSVVAGTEGNEKKISIADTRTDSDSLSFGTLKGSAITVTSAKSALRFGSESVVDAKDDIVVSSAGTLTLGQHSQVCSANGDIRLNGDQGVVQGTSGSIQAEKGDVTVTVKDKADAATVSLDGSVVAGQKFEVASNTGLALRNVTAKEDIDLGVSRGDVTIKGVIQSTDGHVSVAADRGSVTLAGNDGDSPELAAKSSAMVTAYNGISLRGNITAGGPVALETKNGDVTQAKGWTIQSGDNVSVKTDADHGIYLYGTVDSGRSFAVDTGNKLELNNLKAVNDVDLQVANGSMTIGNAIAVTEGSLTLNALKDINAKDLVSESGFVKVSSGTGKLTVNGDVTGAGEVSLQGAGGVVFAEKCLAQGSTVNIGSEGGKVEIVGNVKAAEDVGLTARDGIVQSGKSVIEAGRDVIAKVTDESAAVKLDGTVIAGRKFEADAGKGLTIGDLQAVADTSLRVVDGDLTVSKAITITDGSLSLSADNGSVYAYSAKGVVTLASKDAMTIGAANDVKLQSATTESGPLDVTAGDTLTVVKRGTVAANDGDVTLTGTKGISIAQNGSVVASSGAVTLTADDDDGTLAISGNVTAGTDVALKACSGISQGKRSTIDAGEDVIVSVEDEDAAILLEGETIAGQKLEINAGTGLTINKFTAGADTALSVALGDMKLTGSATVNDGKLMLAVADGRLTMNDVKADALEATAPNSIAVYGNVETVNGATLEGATVRLGGSVSATAESALIQATASSGDLEVSGDVIADGEKANVKLSAKTGVSQHLDSTITAGNAVEVLASGREANVSLGRVTAGSLKATAEFGSVSVNDLVETTKGAVTLTARSDLTVGGQFDSGIKAKTDVQLSGDAISINGPVEAVGGNVVASAKDAISVAGAVTAAGTVYAEAKSGDIDATGAVSANGGALTLVANAGNIAAKGLSARDSITATAGGALTAGDAVVSESGSVDLKAVGNLTVGGAVTANGGAVTLAADQGGIAVKSLTARDNLIATAGGKLAVNGGVTSTAGDAKLTAGDLLSVSGGVLAEAGDVTLEGTAISASGTVGAGEDFNAVARAGDIDFNGIVTVKGKSVLTASAGNVRAMNGENDFGGTVKATAAGDIRLANRATLTVGDLTAGAAGAITLTTGSLKSDGTIALTGEKLEISAEDSVDLALRTGRAVDSLKANVAKIKASNGALDIVSSEVAKMDLSAVGGVTVQNNVGDLTLSVAASGGAVDVTTAGDLDVSALTTGKDVVLTASGTDSDIRADNGVRIGGTATLTAEGDIVMDNAANHIVGAVTALSSGGDVSLANDRALQVDRLQAGTAHLQAKGDVTVTDASVDKVSAIAKNGIFDFTNDRSLTLLSLAADAATLSVAGDLTAPSVVDIASGVAKLDVAGTVELHNQGSLDVTSEGVLDVNGISSEKGNVTITAAKIVQTANSSVEEDNGVVDINGLKAGVVARNGIVTLTSKAKAKTEGEGETIANSGSIGSKNRYVTVEAKTVNAAAEGELNLARLGGDWTLGSANGGTITYENRLDLVVEGKIGSDAGFAFSGSDVTLTAQGYDGVNSLDMDAGGVLAVKRTSGSAVPQYPMFVTVEGSSVPTVTTWDPHNRVYVTINGNQYPATAESQYVQTMSGTTAPNLSSSSIGPKVLTPKAVGLGNPFWVTTDLEAVDLIGCGTIDLQLDKAVEVETKGDWPAEKKVKTHAKNLMADETVFCGQTVSMK